LLGEGQSGEMQAIGFSLYMDLLSRAVDALKEGKEIDLNAALSSSTEVDLQIPALIPQTYLDDVQLRLQFYKRIATANSESQLDEIHVEMIDRFGLTPEALKNLFAVTVIKQRAEKLGMKKIEANAKGGKIEFSDKTTVDPLKIIKLIQLPAQKYRLDGPTKFRFSFEQHEPKDRLTLVNNVLSALES